MTAVNVYVMVAFTRDVIFHRLVTFSLFDLILLFQTSNCEENLYKDLTYLTPFTFSQTCICLIANLMPSNLTLSLTVYFCAVHGYAVTHMHITYVILLFHSATTMWLPHVSLSYYAFCRTVLVGLIQTCIYV